MNTHNESAVLDYTDWQQIPWNQLEEYVVKLQQRIYQAETYGEKRKVRDLQRMLLNSKANLLISIRRVTQVNAGKRIAGVDGYLSLTPEKRIKLYYEMKQEKIKLHNPKPAYRTYITKKNGKLSPLEISTIKDRIYQSIVKNALEPQWEARFEPTSYGFRPKRNEHDAIERIYTSLAPGKKQWIFEGTFKGCFDRLSHDYILEQLGNFPAKELIAKWLKAGFIDNNAFNVTMEGIPQGGIISPLLVNIALHGMEEALGIKYYKISHGIRKGKQIYGYENQTTYTMSRYADYFVVMCETKEQAEKVYELLKVYLEKRGLELPSEKTKVINIWEGFDFLGFTIRRFKTQNSSKLICKPSNESIEKFKYELKDIFKQMIGNNVEQLINRVNPVIIGYANYWSSVVSKEMYSKIDNYVWNRTVRFLKRLHPKKSWKWVVSQYFKPDKTGQSKNKWILTDPVTGNQLIKMTWIPIKRHAMVQYNFSPFDKNKKVYFDVRDKKEFDRNNVLYRRKLAKRQNYICPFCGKSLAENTKSCETHHRIPRCHGGTGEYKNLWLVHTACHIDYHRVYPAKGKLPTEIQLNDYIELRRR